MIYLVERTDRIDDDETDSVVVEADSVARAREVAKRANGDQLASVWDTAVVTPLGATHPTLSARGVILHASFHAG